MEVNIDCHFKAQLVGFVPLSCQHCHPQGLFFPVLSAEGGCWSMVGLGMAELLENKSCEYQQGTMRWNKRSWPRVWDVNMLTALIKIYLGKNLLQ